MTSVDVIIPCFNYAHYLDDCVRSVLTQERVKVRVLIIDDASSDHTPKVASGLSAADPRVTFRRHEKNLGHIATYNEGIEWVSGKYYLLLSADDYLAHGALGRAAELMDGDPSIGFCHGSADELFPDGRLAKAMPEFAPNRLRANDLDVWSSVYRAMHSAWMQQYRVYSNRSCSYRASKEDGWVQIRTAA